MRVDKSNIFVILLALLMLNFSASAQISWLGSYQFEEDGGKTAGGMPIFIVHQLDIIESDDGLIAMVQSNGFQTSRDLVCTTKAEGKKLLFFFENYGENNSFQPYVKGDLLFTLEQKTSKDKAELLTYWDKFQPIVPKNEKSGKVYFQKTEASPNF